MRLPLLLLGLLAPSVLASDASSDAESALTDSTNVYIQPISSTSTPPALLASIAYNPSTLDASLESFESPDLPEDAKLLRVGTWDAGAATWKSSTSTTSAESFARGFRPTFVVTLDAQGGVLGVTIKSSAVDAGQTRDFAPGVVVRKGVKGKAPELNRPVVLSKEGKVEAPEEEKTFFQKYWMLILGALVFMMMTGGEK